jgi:hypothetical protein
VRIINGPLCDQIGLLGALRPHERGLVLLQLLGGQQRKAMTALFRCRDVRLESAFGGKNGAYRFLGISYHECISRDLASCLMPTKSINRSKRKRGFNGDDRVSTEPLSHSASPPARQRSGPQSSPMLGGEDRRRGEHIAAWLTLGCGLTTCR